MLKEVSQPYNILGSTTLSGTTVVTTSATMILYKDSVGYQINFSGVPTGTININGSLDYNPGLPQTGGVQRNGNWTTITNTSLGSGSLTPVIFNLNQLSMPWTQVQFISSTSSGVVDCWVVAKSLG